VQKRNHAVRTCMVGQACYLVAIINEGKRIIFEEQEKTIEQKQKPWKDVAERKPLRIGILGCGGLGKSLARNLQKFSDIHTKELLISTRQPELLTEFIGAGISCFFDNKKLVKSTDLTFICCLPSQLEDVMEEIKGSVRCLLYTFVVGVPRTRICKWLNFFDVIKPEIILGDKKTTDESNWNCKQSISNALETASSCELSCPGNSTNDIVATPWKLAELMIYIFVNMCIVQGIQRKDISYMVNSVIFGIVIEKEKLVLKEEDLWNKESMTTLVPITLNKMEYEIFSLDKLHATRTEVEKILEDSKKPSGSIFRKRYVKLFDKKRSWRTTCELVQN